MGYRDTYGATRKLTLDGGYWVRVREFSEPEEQALIEDHMAALNGAAGDGQKYIAALRSSGLVDQILRERVVGWNLDDEQGQIIPFSPDAVLAEIGPEHQQKIIEFLMPERLKFLRVAINDMMDQTAERLTGRRPDAPTLPEDATAERVTPIRRAAETEPDPKAPVEADPGTDAGF